MISIPMGSVLSVMAICLCQLMLCFGNAGVSVAAISISVPASAAKMPYLYKTRLVGKSIAHIPNVKTPAQCASLCKQNSRCTSWSWLQPAAPPRAAATVGITGRLAAIGTPPRQNDVDPVLPAPYCELKYGPQQRVSDNKSVSGYITDTVCAAYGKTSVQQQRDNLHKKCGFRGALWHLDYNAHYNECMKGSNRQLIKAVMQRRQSMLDRCIQTITVPNVLGRLEQQARLILAKVGLKTARSMQNESDKPDNIVLEQYPLAGMVVEAGDVIRLVIARQVVVEQPIVVPNLLGLQYIEAENILRKHQLKAGRTTKQESEQVSGIVLSQGPQPKSSVKVGSAVHITISEQVVRVPRLIKLGEKEAVKKLESAGLRSGSIIMRAVSGKHDEVLKQSPAAGKMVKIDSPVNIVIAIWAMVVVPDLIGLDVERAKSMLDQYGLATGSVASNISEQKEKTVLSQQPSAGIKVKAGSPVDMIVADQMVLVPDLTGLSRDRAHDLLMQLGLQSGEIREQFSLQQENSVIDQYPAPKSRVKPGSKVRLALAVHATLILISAGTLFGLLVGGAAYSFQVRSKPIGSATAAAGPVPAVRVKPYQDGGSSQVIFEGQQTMGHEIQFKPVADQGEQQLFAENDANKEDKTKMDKNKGDTP